MRDYIIGLGFFTVSVGGSAATAWLVARRRLAWIAADARAVAFVLLLIGTLALAHLMPLAFGVLTRGTAAATTLLIFAAIKRFLRPATPEPSEPLSGARSSAPQWALAALAVAVPLVYIVAFLRLSKGLAISDVDATTFHFPSVASWIQSGTLWHVYDYGPGWGFGAYPQTGNLLQLAAVLPWHDDFLLRALNPSFLVFAGFSTFALAAELGASRASAAVLAAMAAIAPVSLSPGLDNGGTDMFMAATFVSGSLFLVRHARTGRREELLLAGLGLGLAFGTKWYGPPYVAAVLAIWLVVRGRTHRSWRVAIRDAATTGALSAVVGGFWLVRNLAVYANPVFPARVHIFGATIFDGPVHAVGDHYTFYLPGDPYTPSLLHYLTNARVLRDYVWPQFERSFALPGAVVMVGTVVACVLAWRRRSGRALAVGVAALALLVVYASLPYTGLGPPGQPIYIVSAIRYALPAMLSGAAATAWAAGCLGRLELVMGVVGLAAIAQAFWVVRHGLFHTVGLTSHAFAVTAVALTLIGGAGLLIARRRPPIRVLGVGTVLLCALLAVAGRRVEHDFDAARYHGIDPAFDYVAAHVAQHKRIALAGATSRDPYSSPIVAFGPRMSNYVAYVGAHDHRLLVSYLEAPAFVRALEAGHFDLLLVGRGPELQWARTAGWSLVASDPYFTALRPPSSMPR